ncbi:hypothetical protein D3C85_1428940 [compost metagenome]
MIIGLWQQPSGEAIQPQSIHLPLTTSAIVICLPFKALQGLHQSLRLSQLAQRESFCQLEAGDHLVVELLIVDDGDSQCRQAEAGSLPGHAPRSADGKVVLLHQLRHLVALAQ